MVKIKIQQFEGPLDLLLKLIEEKKLNIAEVSISAVTEQFLEYMRSLTDLRPQELANWLVVASKLLVIKSRALMPLLSVPEDNEEDATDLTWQLYQYKLYKEASRHIDQVQKRKKQSWGRSSNFLQKITFYPDPKVNMAALRDSVLEAKALGFDGKGCIHPRQIAVIHDAFAPSEAELEKAGRIVAAFEEAEKQGLGVVSLGSKMIDPPVVKRAMRVVKLADAMS